MKTIRHDCKKQGEMAELQFLAKASSLGFTISKPYGDSSRYDFILDNGRRLLRVQVRSSGSLNSGVYQIHTRGGKKPRPFTDKEIEAIIAYVIPEDAWYVIPIKAVPTTTNVFLAPHVYRSKAKYELYRDAWHLLR